jgi:UDP-GlcNAc:undecaprenyl-phosphate GlcNAc-1-phosphate transferase
LASHPWAVIHILHTVSDLLLLLLSLIAGAVVAQLAVPPLAALCHRHGWLDQPSPRKPHPRATPRLTGIALYLAIWVPLAAATVLAPTQMTEFSGHLLALWLGSLLVLALGILDDVKPQTSVVKLSVQTVAGTLLFLSGLGFDRVWIPFVGGLPLGLFAWPVTILWFLVLANAINIIDGLDGLAVSTTAIGTLTLIWVSWTINLPPVWVGAAALLGGLVIFWRYNKPPAKVFMGDSGSLSLGYFFAMMALFAPIKRFTALAFFVPILALLLPLLEAGLSFGRRSLSGKNPLRGDVGHLHHQLLAAGWSPHRILVAYNLVAVVVGGFCVAFRYGNRRVLTLILGIFVLSLLVSLGIILRRRTLGVGPTGQATREG